MKYVAITSCSTGIAHTYMAAEALQIAAKEMNVEMKVETQGSNLCNTNETITRNSIA